MSPSSDRLSRDVLAVSSGVVDSSLAALFASSARPIAAPSKARYSALISQNHEKLAANVASAVEPDESQAAISAAKNRKRRRKVSDDDDDLEDKYLHQVAEEPLGKRHRTESSLLTRSNQPLPRVELPVNEESSSDMLIHESISQRADESEPGKAACTVFLSNVSTEAITSRSAKKTLLAHLSSVLDESASPSQSIVSLRFRSVPFSTASIPKKAAFITKSIMDATTKSTNAYVVYSTTSAANLAAEQLNGSVVLGRHLRADNAAHPAPIDHRRCIFVGNLGFVDDETVHSTKTSEDGEQSVERRKRIKAPMDVEEGLWRTFGTHAGKVESVRVVREEATRVGKGIAYVQFHDGNSVESALLLSGKKFPPLLPRELRISRCQAPHKTARAMERSRQSRTNTPASRFKGVKGRTQHTAASGGLSKRPGVTQGAAAASSVGQSSGGDRNNKGRTKIYQPPGLSDQVVFEGRRASARDGRPKDLKIKGAARGKKTGRQLSNNKKRQDRRTATWREKQENV